MKVLLATQPMPAAVFIEAIRARAPALALVEYRSSLSDAELADVDIVLGWQMPAGLPARLPRLRWVCSVAAGVEKLLAPELAPDVRVARIVDREQAAGIAQFVVAMALRHARSLELYEAQQRARDWTRRPLPIARHPVGVLGTGAMGGEIAAWLERCGLVVRGWNRRSPESFDELLAGERNRRLRAAVDADDRGHPRRARVRTNAARRLRHQRRPRTAHRRAGPDRGGPLGPSQRRCARRAAARAACRPTTRSGRCPESRSRRTSPPSRRPRPSPTSSSPAFAPSSAASPCSTKSTAPAATEKRPQRGRPLPLGGRGAKRGGSNRDGRRPRGM